MYIDACVRLEMKTQNRYTTQQYSFLDRAKGSSHTLNKIVKSVGLWLDKKGSRSYIL